MQNTSQGSLRSLWIRSLWIGTPPFRKQRTIVSRVATQAARIDEIATANRNTIKLLKERREAVVAAAVTGQLDIPGVTS